MKFNGKQLTVYIKTRATDLDVPAYKIRKELLKVCDVKKQALSLWESGSCPSIENLVEIKKYFGLDNLNELIID